MSLRWGAGFYPRGPGVRATRWTDGDAIVELTLPRDVDVPVEIVFDHQRPAETLPVEVTIEVDGRKVATTSLGVADSRLRSLRGVAVRFAARGRSDGEPVEVRLRSDTFRPSDVVGGDDTRLLGVPVRYVRIGSGPLSYAAAVAPSVLVTDLRPAFLETYDRLLSISEFTSYWVRRNWGVDSDLLWPPVTQFPRGTKEPLILSVGRFFEAHQGHSKKQLEMVRAFRRLHDAGGATGWTLHLVGGCAPEAEGYVASVRAAAAGYPVELHVNASGSTVRDLYGRASIYWHATGLGENVERDPHRLEHFGITTVEAMSAGAVPVVFAAAGQLETVRPDVDGFHFRSERELVEATGRLIEDEALLTRMAEQAERRAEDFSLERFCERLSRLLTDIE